MGERGVSFFKLLKKQDRFEWTEEVERAFQDLKRYLSSPLILTPPNEKEELFLYIAATPQVVSTVLAVERECPEKKAKVQKPVYYVSEVLHDAKLRYPQVQKLIYAVLMSFWKLRHYFQAHRIAVVTMYPLKDVIHNQKATG